MHQTQAILVLWDLHKYITEVFITQVQMVQLPLHFQHRLFTMVLPT